MDAYETAVVLWKRREIENDAQLAEVLNGHSIAFAYHSGKIENALITYHDTREIFEHDGVTAYTGDLRTLFEIRNAKDADVEAKLSELLSEVQDFPDDRALTAAAYFHAKFENIHPFADGNGRTGRLLMNYLLVPHGHPPIVIHEEDRRAYFDALEAWVRAQDLAPLTAFLKNRRRKPGKKRLNGQTNKQVQRSASGSRTQRR